MRLFFRKIWMIFDENNQLKLVKLKDGNAEKPMAIAQLPLMVLGVRVTCDRVFSVYSA